MVLILGSLWLVLFACHPVFVLASPCQYSRRMVPAILSNKVVFTFWSGSVECEFLPFVFTYLKNGESGSENSWVPPKFGVESGILTPIGRGGSGNPLPPLPILSL